MTLYWASLGPLFNVYSRRFATRPPARMVMVPGSDEVAWASLGPLLGLSWAFVQRIFTYVGSMLALYNAMSGPPGVHRTLCQDHVRPMLDPKYALKSVSNKTCF